MWNAIPYYPKNKKCPDNAMQSSVQVYFFVYFVYNDAYE